jgi:uncharacterized protein YcbX
MSPPAGLTLGACGLYPDGALMQKAGSSWLTPVQGLASALAALNKRAPRTTANLARMAASIDFAREFNPRARLSRAGQTLDREAHACEKPRMHVSAIHLYPVKSCRGISVEAAEVVARGFALDRRWVVADADGNALTQRTVGRLALVHATLDGEAIQLTTAGQPPLRLPRALDDGVPCTVQVWGDRVDGLVDEAASAWLTRALGLSARAVYMPDEARRPVEGEAALVSFADAFPFLVISEASLEDLNLRLPSPVPMARFRPNLVVRGAAPYAEDGWTRLRIGGVELRGVKRCGRCVLTTVDPETGERGSEPLRTLSTYRKEGSSVYFGMNLVHDGLGAIRVGDPVHILP